MLSIWASALVISADRRAISARSRVIQSSQAERSARGISALNTFFTSARNGRGLDVAFEGFAVEKVHSPAIFLLLRHRRTGLSLSHAPTMNPDVADGFSMTYLS